MKKLAWLALTVGFTAACSGTSSIDEQSPDVEGAQGAEPEADRIAPKDDPRKLIPEATFALKDVVSKDDVGKTFMVPEERMPYPDTYWPFTQGGVDAVWLTGSASPLEKFVRQVSPGSLSAAKQWEHANHGKGLPGVAEWFGHCPGWAAAAVTGNTVRHPVNAMFQGGRMVECTAGSAGCETYQIGDINALAAETYVDADSDFIGARCDTKPTDIKLDAFGRIVREQGGGGCQGLNAGSLMVVLAHRLKMASLPFVINAQTPRNTDEIWNQPTAGYKVYRYQTVTMEQAAQLVSQGVTHRGYQWNSAAKAFAFVEIGLYWITENGPNTRLVSGRKSMKETKMSAILELDGPTNSQIIGGEYLPDASRGESRLSVAPFAWTAKGPGPDNGGGSDGHNPHIRSSLVQQLIELGK